MTSAPPRGRACPAITLRNKRPGLSVTVTFAWSFFLNRSSPGSSKRSNGALSATLALSPASLVRSKATLAEKVGAESSGSLRSYERCPQPFELQMRCSLYVRGVKPRGAARNPRANPHAHSIPLGQGWSSGGCSALVSCAPNQKSGPLIPSLSFPPPLTKVLPAQVARSARRRSTSRLHERARHVWRRGTVHSSL